MIIYLVRHPQTEWNKKKIVQGWKDSALTISGKTTAKKIGRKLMGKNISTIYSSDLGRCVQTSQIISSMIKAPVITRKELRERNFGVLNGKPAKFVEKKLDLSDPDLKPIDGESFNEMKSRVLNFVKGLSRNNNNKKSYLIVAHEGGMKAILSEIYTLDFTDKKCNSTPLTILKLALSNNKIILSDRIN